MHNESQNIEYKESWRDEYLKWICGFANAQGGIVYLSKPRNLHIANVFCKAGFIEAWGRGYKKIREEFESENAPLPTLKETCGGILMSIVRPDIGNGVGNDVGNDVGNVTLTERQRKIYHLIAASADITAKQMAEILDVTERTIERELAKLQQRNIIRHEGKARTGHWVTLL